MPHAITTSYLTHGPIEEFLRREKGYGYTGPLYLSAGKSVGLRLIPTVRDLRFVWEDTPQQLLDAQAQKVRDSVRAALVAWALQTGEAASYTDNLPLQCMHPVGHWYEVPNLLLGGVLQKMLEARPELRTLMVHNVDTVGAALDPGILGRHLASKSTMTAVQILTKVVNAPIGGSAPGALASAGNVGIQVSLDNGVHWGKYTLVPSTGVVSLSAAAGAVLGDTGLVLQFLTTGYYNVGDLFYASCRAPVITSGLPAAFMTMLADTRSFSLVDIAGLDSTSNASGAMYTDCATAAALFFAAYRSIRIFMSTPADTDANIVRAWQSTAFNTRLNVSAATDMITDVIYGANLERGHSDALVARLCTIAPSRSPGYVPDGPLFNVVSMSRNEASAPGLFDQGFACSTSAIQQKGVFTDGDGRCMSRQPATLRTS